jgi:ABC-type Mn2+/Zn2+ transport system permease subunit
VRLQRPRQREGHLTAVGSNRRRESKLIIDALISPLATNTFMMNALLAGILVSIACGIVGTLVVLRGLAFIGDALGHGVLPGVAIAMLFGLPGMLGAAAGSLAMIVGIGFVVRRSSLSSDTAIGLLFVGMLALGVAIVSRSRAFAGDLIHILFGEILGITVFEIVMQLVATIVIAGVTTLCYRPFLLLCVNPEQADVSGFSSKRYHGIMLALIALTVVVSFRTVGTLLVFGLLLAPAATAALFSRKVTTMIALASAIGAFSVYVGLLASYHANIAAGAAIVLVATFGFFIALTVKRLFGAGAGRGHAH